MLSSEYEREQSELEETAVKEQAELDTVEADADRIDRFMALIRKYTDFTELTTPMINEFVDKVLVHAPERENGERVQEIEIYLKFIGKFDLPQREPTEEELAAMEKARKVRARQRENCRRYRERKKQREAEKNKSEETTE